VKQILTEQKRSRRRGFPKGVSGNPSKKFTSNNQPSPAAKVKGRLKKKRGVELIRCILELYGKENLTVKKQAADYFGIAQNEINIETLLILQQVQKAIEKSDSYAFNTIMDRLYGKPSQPAQVEINEGNTFLDFLKKTSKRAD
jgi:hypothetical protein